MVERNPAVSSLVVVRLDPGKYVDNSERRGPK